MSSLYLGNSPIDAAMAHFDCALSLDRLGKTPADELEAALGKRPKRSNTDLSTVYVIGNEANGLRKIGYADNLRNRFSGLNCSSPVALRLEHFVHVVDGVVAKLVEGEAHRILAEYRRKGEWFEITVDQAADAIRSVILHRQLRWWTEEESWRLAEVGREYLRQHEARGRFFG